MERSVPGPVNRSDQYRRPHALRCPSHPSSATRPQPPPLQLPTPSDAPTTRHPPLVHNRLPSSPLRLRRPNHSSSAAHPRPPPAPCAPAIRPPGLAARIKLPRAAHGQWLWLTPAPHHPRPTCHSQPGCSNCAVNIHPSTMSPRSSPPAHQSTNPLGRKHTERVNMTV